MSLDFCCDIQKRTWKHGSILPCLNGSGWWWLCNGVGDIFLAHFGPLVPIEHCLNATDYLSIVADHVHPLWLQCTHILMATSSRKCTMSQISNHLDWFLEHDNEFTLLKWPPPDLNPIEHLWDVVEREILMDVQPANLQLLILSCQYGPNIWGMFSNNLLNQCHEELR